MQDKKRFLHCEIAKDRTEELPHQGHRASQQGQDGAGMDAALLEWKSLKPCRHSHVTPPGALQPAWKVDKGRPRKEHWERLCHRERYRSIIKVYSELCLEKLSAINCHPIAHREYWKSRGSKSRKSETAHRRSHFQGRQILQLHLLLQPAAPPWNLLQLYHMRPQTNKRRCAISINKAFIFVLSSRLLASELTNTQTTEPTLIVYLELHRGQKVLISGTESHHSTYTCSWRTAFTVFILKNLNKM